MSDLDSLQIEIISDSKKAEDAINSLISGLENLNDALKGLDVSKITAFTNAVSKLSNIGSTTNTTSKALRGMSNQLSKTFGIKSKEGIKDLNVALNDFYEATKRSSKDSSLPTQQMYVDSAKALHKAITENASYKKELRDDVRIVKDFYDAQKANGSVFSLKGYKDLFDDKTWAEYKKSLGSVFTFKKFSNEQGVGDIENFFSSLYKRIPDKAFFSDTQNPLDTAEAIKTLVNYLDEARNSTLRYKEAVDSQVISGNEAKEGVIAIGEQLKALVREQNEFSGENGLKGVVSAMQALGSVKLPDMTGVADAVKALNSNPPSNTAKAVADIKSSDAQDYFYKIEDTAKGTALAIRDVGTTALALADQFKPVEEAMKNAFDNQKVEEFKNTVDSIPSDPLNNVAESAKKIISPIEQALETMREMKKLISDMENGKTPFDLGDYQNAIKMYDQASDKVSDFKKKLTEPPKEVGMADVLENLIALGEALEKVSQKFGMLANTGIKLFKGLVTPLKWAANEYVEKFENMKASVDGFVKRFQKGMDKISQFWKRTMKTFTFMIVRKVFTAIIKEVGNAVQSLAMWSNAMGTAFNNDISLMVADFQYLGRSIISVFAPLLNTIAPIIDAIVDKIATLISYIGMLFAALGGGTSFTKAKKNVTNYAESLDSASKSAKNLTMGIDELNILNEKSGGGGAKPYDGWEDGWEQVEIPAWILNLSDFFKKLWDDFFAPLKEAWERAKQYLIDGFKTMINSIKQLLADIGRDFLEMWNQEKTIRMFEQILKIFGDLMRVVRELANNFDEAWNKGQVGLRIFENLRDIAAILVDHVRNVSYYMIGWAKEIDFSPMLESFEKMTKKLKPLADFVGGVFEDVMKDGILKYIEFLIKDAIPHLEDTIGEVADAFSFKKMRKQLKPLWAEIEGMFENIHTGITSTIGNIGKEIAKFTNSRTFEMFLQNIIDLTNEITSARVEKVLTGLAQGILAIAKAVVDFVNSDIFQGFIKFIGDWIDKHSSDDIAGILTKIAGAIAVFKFAEFTTGKLSGFLNFLTTLTAMKNLVNIASDLGHLSGRITEVGVAASAHKITSYAEGFSLLGTKIVNLPSALGSLGTAFLDLHNHIGLVTKTLGLLFVGFEEFKHVSKNVENLTLALNGDDSKSLNSSLLGVVATVGVAALAFTALLGFPAGLIATGVVGAIAAIKGISDAVEQINFEHMTDAIMTQGETTVDHAREWYQETTAIVSEYTNKWIDIERDLTQDRSDINEYAKSIEGLNIAIQNNKEATATMADTLVGKYESLGSAITNYIDKSTDSIITSLLAQRAYLESQGESTEKIDKMIAEIYQNADAEKNAITGAIDNLREAYKAYEEEVEKSGATSDAAIEKYGEYVQAATAADEAVKTYVSDVNSVDVTEGVKKITELGETLDLSQYTHDEEGLAQAKQDIERNLDEIQATFTEEMGKVNQTYTDRVNELDQYAKEHPWFTEDMYDESIANIERETAEARDTLISSTGEALDLYSNNLSQGFAKVAEQADKDWENKGWWEKTFGIDKQAYIQQQIQTYADNLVTGDAGLSGKLTDAYKDLYEYLPDAVSPDVEAAMQGILENQGTFFITYSDGTQALMVDRSTDMLQAVLDAANQVDFNTPASVFGDEESKALDSALENIQYDEKGFKINTEIGNSLLDNVSSATEPAAQVANEIAETLDTETATAIEGSTNLESSMHDYGYNAGEALGKGIEDSAEGLKTVINWWFGKIDDWIHGGRDGGNEDLPFGSPNKKTKEYGAETVEGFNLGITTNASTSITAIGTWFTYINAAIKNKLGEVKTTFNTMLTSIFSGTGWDYNSPITTLFTNVTSAISNNLTVLGTTMTGTMLPEFVNTYLMPFFSQETWQPLFDMLREVFVYQLEDFKTWFTESMSEWWENDLTAIFKAEKWNAEIFTPLSENIKSQFEKFKTWWNKSMNDWWKDKVVFWFKSAKWDEEIYTPLKENLHKHFDNFIEYWDKSMNTWWKDKVLFWFKTLKWDEEIYTPLKDNLHKHWDAFIKWWDESLNKWWDEHVLVWFKDELWDNDIYNPIKENLYGHFESFLRWWDEALDDWWTNHVKPYFEAEKWAEQFDNVHEQADDSFGKVKEVIDECMSNASDAVSEACEGMANSLTKLIELIGNVEMNVKNFGKIGGNVSFNYVQEFASGGFPTMGSLFLAGENGAGAELVGNVGGKTGVVSNGEITGIADAVYATGNQESELLTQLLQVTQSLLDKDPVVIGDRDIAQMAQNGQSQMGMSIIS